MIGRNVVMAAVLLAATVAHAEPVADLAKQHIEAIPTLVVDTANGLAKDASVVDHHGRAGGAIDGTGSPKCKGGAFAQHFYCFGNADPITVGTVLAGTSGDVGWFQIPFSRDLENDDHKPFRESMRASGVAIKVGSTWTIHAIAYGFVVPDAQLKTRPRQGIDEEMWHASKEPIDVALANTVRGWFKSGFAARAVKTGAIAAGNSATDTGSGATALRLVKTWDKLRLVVDQIDARVLAGGKAGWVHAIVLMPRTNKKPPYRLVLAAVVVPDGKSWRWASLHYFSPAPDRMEDVVED
ncbi:MAG: hypothetical protein IPQ07_02070 [Myxococcales bacterium]|nr:hypothetical protein [Myxococcales bacterium]